MPCIPSVPTLSLFIMFIVAVQIENVQLHLPPQHIIARCVGIADLYVVNHNQVQPQDICSKFT